MSDSGSQASGTQAIDRAAEMLALVVRSPDPLTFATLQERTGLAKSTTSRLLHALERHQLIRRGGDGAFRPGQLFTHYAAVYDLAGELIDTAGPLLERLSELTGETVNMAILRGRAAVQVAQLPTTYPIEINWVGQHAPPHCSADGKVYLAHGRLPLPTGRLVRRTPRTITRRVDLAAELAEIRRRGYAVTVEELQPDLVAAAAPLRSETGDVLATVSVSAVDGHLDERRAHELGRLLCAEIAAWSSQRADALSAQAGGDR